MSLKIILTNHVFYFQLFFSGYLSKKKVMRFESMFQENRNQLKDHLNTSIKNHHVRLS